MTPSYYNLVAPISSTEILIAGGRTSVFNYSDDSFKRDVFILSTKTNLVVK